MLSRTAIVILVSGIVISVAVVVVLLVLFLGGKGNGTGTGTGTSGADTGTDTGTSGTETGTDTGTSGTDTGTDTGTSGTGTDTGTTSGTGTDTGTTPCSGHGKLSGDSCVCAPNYVGENCEQCADGHGGYDKHGCNRTNSNWCNDRGGILRDGTCKCEENWSGDRCEKFTAKLDASTMNYTNKVCNDPNNKDCVVVTAGHGEEYMCPDGYIGVAACQSGKDLNCKGADGKYYNTLLYCAKLPDGFKADEKNGKKTIIDTIDSDKGPIGVNKITVGPNIWYYRPGKKTCPEGYFMTGGCSSGENPDCTVGSGDDRKIKITVDGKKSPLHDGQKIRGKLRCTKFNNLTWESGPKDPQTYIGGYFYGQYAPYGKAIAAFCNGGKNSGDCPHNQFASYWYAPIRVTG